MNNFGIKQIGILKCQYGTPRGGLVNHLESGTWGDRGQGNELTSALENGLSWIGDKIVNGLDYVEDGLAYLVGSLPGEGLNGELLVENNRRRREALSRGALKYEDVTGEIQTIPISGKAPIMPKIAKNPTPEILKLYENLKKLRVNWQVRESLLRKANLLDKMESTAAARKYREAEQAYNEAVKAGLTHMKKMVNDVRLGRKQNASFKHNKAAATDDMRAYNLGRPVLKERLWDWVEEMMRKDPKAAGIINRYEIKKARGMDKKLLREARKKMLEEYAKSKPGFFDYILKKNE